jgi:hypothetical protein
VTASKTRLPLSSKEHVGDRHFAKEERRERRGQTRASYRHYFRLDYRNLEEQLSDGNIANVSLPEIKTAIEQLSFEERAELAAWLHGWNDDEWDEQMKRDIGSGKLDDVLQEVEEDIKSGRTREMP